MRACLFTTILIAATFASACAAPTEELALKSATFHTPVASPPVAGTMFFPRNESRSNGVASSTQSGACTSPR